VLLRLSFTLRDSAQKGDSYAIAITDASIATVTGSTDNTTLSSVAKTLRTKDCKISVK